MKQVSFQKLILVFTKDLGSARGGECKISADDFGHTFCMPNGGMWRDATQSRGDLGTRWLLPHGPTMPKVDLDAIPPSNATGYPPPYDVAVRGRWWRRLAPVLGLTEMGASHVVLAPGACSSQRHWHDGEDELVVMLSGEAVLIEDAGETVLRAGDVAGWRKGTGDGHQLVNRSEAECSFVAIGAGPRGGGGYSDIDMLFTDDGRYTRKDGTPYPHATRI